MKYTLLALVVALTPGAAMAWEASPAKVVIVDMQRVYTDCTACKSAQTALQAQAGQLQQRAQQLSQPLQTEAEAIQKVTNGKEPDEALQARIRALQAKEADANRELQERQRGFERNRAYVAEQIEAKVNPIIQQIMQQRGANIVMDRNAAVMSTEAVDVTGAVLAQLNTQLPSVNTTAPAEAAAKPAAK